MGRVCSSQDRRQKYSFSLSFPPTVALPIRGLEPRRHIKAPHIKANGKIKASLRVDPGTRTIVPRKSEGGVTGRWAEDRLEKNRFDSHPRNLGVIRTQHPVKAAGSSLRRRRRAFTEGSRMLVETTVPEKQM